MKSNQPSHLKRIGVFYDGNYFSHVSNYYNYEHERQSRLSISGLHDFIRQKVAENENVDDRFCQVIDAHYFRGRLSSHDAYERNRLLAERSFDDILMYEGVVTHYLPLRYRDGHIEEKGIDVWLALEAYELALYKKFDVVTLIAGDGDYVPLVRKLITLGIRVMVLGWDFEYTDDRNGRQRKTVASVELMREATYPITMHEIIDNKMNREAPMVEKLFIPGRRNSSNGYHQGHSDKNGGTAYQGKPEPESEELEQSSIHTLKNGYGFISFPPNNLYFHYTWLDEEEEFNDLVEGDLVEFYLAKNDKGQDVAIDVRKIAGGH